MVTSWTREIAQWLAAQTALAENPNSVPSPMPGGSFNLI